ncbi:hypothetical protein QBC40DRAFT_33483 [Triangularia verruculosa]|uniref:WD40 repeat protein n=1 Tax=Triangularia verruculosa TaxID=2587418 RepID=A0AAN6X7S9_9PEZI|nr:hypothetical protein QBC40DRAFT_33483 [Triangularia verruculosa]
MAGPTPSSLFLRLTNTWRALVLRSDVDDIVLELLGRFSLEKIYVDASDRDAHQQLVITLLLQLKSIFDIQRLTLPTDGSHIGWYLGFLISWEVALRSVEFVLQTIVEGRETLWEYRSLRERYLADFLLSSLRVLTLHPKAPANHRSRDRRERFARIHSLLEQVFDSYPGPNSFPLEVCKEITNQLHVDPDSLGLPPKLASDLPNLTSELYPIPLCLLPASIAEIVPAGCFGSWLLQYLALRDVSHFVVAASIQYAANKETREMHLRSSSARSRNAILTALDTLRVPPQYARVEMVATISTMFRIVLPDTLELSRHDASEARFEEFEPDALDALFARLAARQVIHRVSDREMVHNVTQVVRKIILQDDPSGQFVPTKRPGLYAVNCPECHLLGASQLNLTEFDLMSSEQGNTTIQLAPQTRCIYCREVITIAREVTAVRQAWELLEPLRPDADTINVERHLPTQFQLRPPKSRASGLLPPGYANTLAIGAERPHGSEVYSSSYPGKTVVSSPTSIDLGGSLYPGLVSPQTPSQLQISLPLRHERSHTNMTADHRSKPPDDLEKLDSAFLTDPPPFSHGSPVFKRLQNSTDDVPSIHTPRSVPIVTSTEKGKSKWRLKFTTSKKAPVGISGDSSSLSSTALEAQKLEEISLAPLLSTQKHHGRGKPSKSINVTLSQSSTLALFWTQLLIHVWDVATSPPTMMRVILPESTCILAAVARTHLAYVIGTRDQKLTLRIVNLVQPTISVVEYRIPSSLWCKSIAIDREENYVAVGFENATVRFFKAKTSEPPREDRLHALSHRDCRGCPSVDTLAFSQDGLALLASTRSPKTGLVQTYSWRFPFHAFQELTTCRYSIPLHESEDNGLTAAIFRPGSDGEETLVCITTWTQSGTPVLIQPQDGHRSEIKTDVSGRHAKLGTRIQCAAFSPSGRELVLVNDKGHVFQVSNLNSSPMDIRRIAASKELTAKSDSFAMSFMTIADEGYVVMAWAESTRATGWIKKIPLTGRESFATPDASDILYDSSTYGATREFLGPPVELAATERIRELPTQPGDIV